jgi:hypothetical protein
LNLIILNLIIAQQIGVLQLSFHMVAAHTVVQSVEATRVAFRTCAAQPLSGFYVALASSNMLRLLRIAPA